jgi:hypothetical protein
MIPHEAPPLIAHLRIPHNAGDPVDRVLGRNFGTAFAAIQGPGVSSALSEEGIARLVGASTGILAISSDQLRLPLEAAGDRAILPFLFLRHPIDRITSMFEQEARARSAEEPAEAFPYAMKAWVEAMLDEAPHSICEAQATFLTAGGDSWALPTPIEFREAEYVMEDLPFCGVVDQLDDSLLLFESIVREWFPGFDGTCPSRGVEGGRGSSLGTRLERTKEALGSRLYHRLEVANAYDVQLVEDARRVLARRLEGATGWGLGRDGVRGSAAVVA